VEVMENQFSSIPSPISLAEIIPPISASMLCPMNIMSWNSFRK